MSTSRRQRAQGGNRKAAEASAAAKACAQKYVEFCADRRGCLELAKQHGLSRGIVEYEKALLRLEQQSSRLRAVFKLGADASNASTDTSRGHGDQQQQPACQDLHAELRNAVAGHAVAAGVPPPAAAVPAASSNKPPTPKPAPPPPPPPMLGSKLARPAGKANTSSSSSSSSSGQARAAPKPAPPPPPPPLPLAQRPGNRQLPSQQQQQQGAAATPRSPGVAAPPVPPPLPPAGFTAPGAAAAAGRPRAPPPPPPLRTSAGATPRASAPGAEANSSAATTAAGGQQTPAKQQQPPPPPLLPGSINNSSGRQPPAVAAANVSMHSLAAVAAAAAAVAAAANGSSSSGTAAAAGGGSPFAEAPAGSVGGGKLKTLHVDPVPSHKLPEGSFWRTAHPVGKEFKGVQDSMEYLLRAMFSDVPRRHHQQHHRSSPRNAAAAAAGGAAGTADGGGPEASAGAEGVEVAGEVVTCVPEKRALHVEVVLKRLRMPAAALAAAINLLNTDQLKPDDLASIRSILPKPEELQAVRDAKQVAEKKIAAAVGHSPRTPAAGAAGAASSAATPVTPSTLSPRLGIVEAAFDALGCVELLQAKMRAMEFRYDVDSVASMVLDYTADIARSFKALRSGSLQQLLAFVRDVANVMNRAGPKGPLAGFKLESLARLQSTKMSGSTDLNLLHYIVAHISAVLPGALALDGEREAFRAACRRGTFDAVSVRIRTLLDTQKRLYTDLARAKELQQQRNSQRQRQQQQQGCAAGTAVSDSQAEAGSSSRDGGSGTPRTPAAGPNSSIGADSSSSDSHDTYVARLSELLDSSAPNIVHLQQQLEGVIREFRWLAEFYCEDVKGQAWKTQPVSFLTHFLELLDNITATMKDTGRLARVTAMLADYIETQKSWRLRKLEHQQEEQLWELAAAEAQAAQQAADDEEEAEQSRQALLQHQQQLLREHAASELLRHSAANRASNSSSSSSGDAEEDEQHQQLPNQHQHICSSQSSARSSAEGAQLLVEEGLQQPRQQKPPCVPRLQLGEGQHAAAGGAAGGSSSHAAGVMPELSWGSAIGAVGLAGGSDAADGADGDGAPDAVDCLQAADQQQHLLLRYGSPLQQPVFEEQQATEAADEDQGELCTAAAAARGSMAASWSPKRSMGVHSSGELGHRLITRLEEDSTSSTAQDGSGDVGSPLQACNPLAAAAAGVARLRRAAQTAMSRSLDSGMFAAAYAGSTAASVARPVSSGDSGSSNPPPGGQARSQSQQKLGLRQPWRPAGQGLAAVPGGRKWTQQDAQLAHEVAAAAAAAAGRPRPASPASVGGVKPSVQQQRLDALRLRSKPRTPEPGKQQQQGGGVGGGAGASPDISSSGFDVAGDQHDSLALLLSSIDSEM